MAMVFREVVLTWQGQDYRLVPSLKLMRRLEAEGVGPVGLSAAFAQREPRMAQLAYFISICLTAAGCRKDATEEAIFDRLLDPAQQDATVAVAKALITAFLPQVGDPKKPAGPDATPSPAAPTT